MHSQLITTSFITRRDVFMTFESFNDFAVVLRIQEAVALIFSSRSSPAQ